jgi:Fe-S-cluster containining protein
MADPFFIPLESLHDRASQWFTRARAALLGTLPCGRGCSRCCIGPFAITLLDAGMLRQGLGALAPDEREDIEARAMDQVTAMESVFARLARSPFLDDWSDDEQDAVAARFAEVPCPALDDDGSCRVYEVRPVTCRTMGIPVEEDGLVQGACEIQTTVPIVRLPAVLREEEERLAELEARALDVFHDDAPRAGDEVFLPYGFLPERAWTGFSSIR